MRQIAILLVACLCVLCGISSARATDRFFRDITAFSPNGEYKVEAKSPDNQEEGWRAFQSDFVYTCTNTKTKKVLWTRYQAMGKPIRLSKNSPRMLDSPEEASPVEVFVNDAGWTVILTDWDELIPVDRTGKDRGKIEILDDAFSAREKKKYVHQTTAGPMWQGLSYWFFLEHDKSEYFVVRPWWGKHVVVDLEDGELVEKNDSLEEAILKAERSFVLSEIKKRIGTRKQWETEDGCGEGMGELQTAVYLAGVLHVEQAVALLRQIEGSTYCGCSASSFCDYEPAQGALDPNEYETLGIRQLVHLALRRLGEAPGPYPCARFRTAAEEYKDRRIYRPPALNRPRSENVDELKKNMSLEKVLALLGEPDFVGHQVWSYDMDVPKPYTLEVYWYKYGVRKIERITPPRWKTDQWDEELAH